MPGLDNKVLSAFDKDLTIIGIYYQNKDSRVYIAINHILYYAAQYTIALSILYLVA